MDIKQLRERCDSLFTKRTQFVVMLQEIAENFYPERADFTIIREIGDEFADNLTTSYPQMARREFGDQLGVMLRPTAKEWFHMKPQDEDRETHDAKLWLERANKIQRKTMYARTSMFTRATKEADHDFASFGQAVMSIRPNRNYGGLLYRTWHIRDVVWLENEECEFSLICRKWKPTRYDLQKYFGSKNHPQLADEAKKDPFAEVECYHIICEAQMYDKQTNKPYWSIYYDVTHDHILEETATFNREYVIPRWQTVSGSQYAYSPAVIVALPEARLIQAMTYTLLEAGEKATNPPMVATVDAVKSDVSIYAGGVTWVSNEYDERLGEALRPLNQDFRGIPMGIEMQRDSRQLIAQAFFLNKLTLPQRGPEMTAYEVGQRIQEYIRGAMPIFEPMEAEYNGGICEMTFENMMRMGMFGSPYEIPRSLQGAEINFRFESPLHDAIEQSKGQKWLEGRALLADAAAIDQSVVAMVDTKSALRDVLGGIGLPTKWLRSESAVQDIEDQQAAMQEQAQMLTAMQQGSEVAKNLGAAQKDFKAA
jgi:Bacteriophage head to tail connecting protein